jgi:CDP-glucose 4,6-dehydratase
MGTQSILEGLRTLDHSCVAVLVTSDKCYENNEWIWGYRENDRLGGSDPYSSSKAAAEVLISSYYRSYFSDLNSKIRLASVRAGNVVGGGDWAKDRIVPDCMQNWSDGKTSVLRSPLATRPWQHVLEPLVGYLGLASSLIENRQTSGEAYNFGPDANQVHTVWDLVGALSTRINGRFPSIKYIAEKSSTSDKEAGLLKLNCDKAYSELGWSPILKFNDTINYTADWYEAYYNKNKILTNDQIIDYLSIFKNHKVR